MNPKENRGQEQWVCHQRKGKFPQISFGVHYPETLGMNANQDQM